MNIWKKRSKNHVQGPDGFSLCQNVSQRGARQNTLPVTCPDCLALIQDDPLELAQQTLAVFRAIYPPDILMLCDEHGVDSGPRLTFAVQKALSEFVEVWEDWRQNERTN